MQWTDQIRQVKIVLVVAAVIIAIASLFISQYLVRDLSIEERHKMEVWAEAMRSFSNADENTDLNLVLKVINENNTIPVIVMDKNGEATTFRNIDVGGETYADSLRNASYIGRQLLLSGQSIKIYLDDEGKGDYINVCYDEAPLVVALYPTGHRDGVCGHRHFRFDDFQACRAEQGVGGSFQGDSPSVGYAYLQLDGLDRDTQRELS